MSLFLVVSIVICSYFVTGEKKKLREVIVVGGGIAGMAAARRLQQEGSMYVRVLEARRDRYGGRIWTSRSAAKGTRGADVEMGGGVLNTRARKNPLLNLTEEFELETRNAGSLQLYLRQRNGETRIMSGENATDVYTEAFKIAMNALNKFKTTSGDMSVKDLLIDALNEAYEAKSEQSYDREILEYVFSSFPAVIAQNFSSLRYEIENDFGWDQIIIDGVGTLLDRIVGGASGREAPIKIELNKVLRNIKVDVNRGKVLVRTTDRKQIVADAVVVALPIGVLKSDSVIFDPRLDDKWYKAVDSLGIDYSCKVVVGFDEAFWPHDVGTFMSFSETTANGFLQIWTNSYRVTGNPYLVGNIFGEKAILWESKMRDEQEEIVLKVLGEMFGEETVMNQEITTFLVSNWSSEEYIQGSVSYPQIGSTEDLWNILQEPVCPYIYFAGAYTESSGHFDSLHGAYNSGIRAAEQIINDICESKSKLKRKAKNMNTSNVRKNSTTTKKDEL